MMMQRVSSALAAGALTAMALTGCDGGTSPSPNPTPLPTASPTPTPAGHKDGHFTFTLLSLECGIKGVTGTHSEAPPDGQFCEARLRVRNDDPDFHSYVTKNQRLEGVAEPKNHPDPFAMAVRRQNPEEKIGGSDLVEVELWFDIPLGSKVTGLRVEGDRDAAGFLDNEIVAHAPDGLLIPMTPTA